MSKWHDVYDSRLRLSYEMVSQNEAIYDYRPIYQTQSKQVQVVTMRDVTVWETVPIIGKETVLQTVVTETALEVGGGAGFVGESIKGNNVLIDAAGAARISGTVLAGTGTDVKAGTLLQVQGQKLDANGQLMEARLEAGGSVKLHAGESLLLHDSALVRATGTAGSVTFDSDIDMTLGGDTSATGTFVATAERNIIISGGIAGKTLSIEAGFGAAGDGSVTGDSEARLESTGGDLAISAGDFGGSLRFDQSELKASTGATITLSALGGAIEQVKPTIDGVLRTDAPGTGLMMATHLVAGADTAITLNTAVATADIVLSEAGNIELRNTGALDLTNVVAANGAIDVLNLGTLTASVVKTTGPSDRNDVRLEARGGNIVLGTVATGTSVTSVALNTDTPPRSITTTTTRGDVVLVTTGAISHASGLVTADELSLTAGGAIRADLGRHAGPADHRRRRRDDHPERPAPAGARRAGLQRRLHARRRRHRRTRLAAPGFEPRRERHRSDRPRRHPGALRIRRHLPATPTDKASIAALATVTQAATASLPQVTSVQFNSHAPAVGVVYSLVVGTRTYTVTAGDATTPPAGTVAATGKASSPACRPRSRPTPAAKSASPSTPPRARSP
ncbi:hypothetical protein HK414_16000 [Ramlibacter terrae]|uniref:Carbohydrate-binding domain-containing protein n=1 Tax=Ramlibacter terrae TaxID=2732511 RepID=A0ABX6P527_9BURK|nr:hypothetical protein HK414_16000 [Ramlibacter terrae]